MTSITFDLPDAGRMTLRIYDANGHLVRTLVDGMLEANTHSVVWEGHDDYGRELSSGVYFYRLHAGDRVLSRKLVMMK
jgi:flagellar hook assembly protein FlgD